MIPVLTNQSRLRRCHADHLTGFHEVLDDMLMFQMPTRDELND